MLKYKADIKTLVYLLLVTGILFLQWQIGFHILIYILSLWLAVAVAVIAHNHNHVPMWKSATLNHITDYWITLFYGFPAFAWTPTHNKNHHKFNNRTGDYTITYRFSEHNTLFTLLTYPAVSSYYQQHPLILHLKHLWNHKRRHFYLAIFQYVALVVFIAGALVLDWKKALMFIVIPQQFALFTVLIFNYIQHVHADEESAFNHSRNFVSAFTNIALFNNGYHTAHHHRASTHWSLLPAAHAKLAPMIDPRLNEKVILFYLFKTYVLGIFWKRFRTPSMRETRMAQHAQAAAAS